MFLLDDFNRVVLDANDDPAGCDYINASFIDVSWVIVFLKQL